MPPGYFSFSSPLAFSVRHQGILLSLRSSLAWAQMFMNIPAVNGQVASASACFARYARMRPDHRRWLPLRKKPVPESVWACENRRMPDRRLSRLLGLSAHTDPDKVEADLTALLPHDYLIKCNMQMIAHGRAVCKARRPACGECFLKELCDSAKSAAK